MVWIWVAAGLAGLALLFLIGSLVCFRMAFFAGKNHPDAPRLIDWTEQYLPFREEVLSGISDAEALPCEDVSARSDDGLSLHGRFYAFGKDGSPILLCFHGYRSHAFRDFCQGIRMAQREGYHALLVDQRAHGKSEGSVIGFGIPESRDVLTWLSYLNDRFPGSPILLFGISMGSATVLTASRFPLSRYGVRGILADCPFSSAPGILSSVCQSRRFPLPIVMPMLRFGARVFGGFPLSSASALDSVKSADVPILLIHGEDDRFVPIEMSVALAAANPERITLETFPGAGHGLSYMLDPDRYLTLVKKFFARALNDGQKGNEKC